MSKDSQYYKEKTRKQKALLNELILRLPPCAREYIQSKEHTSQLSTLIVYCYDLHTFFRYIVKRGIVDDIQDIDYQVLNDVSSGLIEAYLNYLEYNDEGEKHNNGNKAIARKLSPIRSLYNYHFIRKNISENPTLLVEIPKIKKDKNIIRLSNEEVNNLLQAIGKLSSSDRQDYYNKRTRLRDIAILTLLLNTGIRVSECNGLDLSDVDFITNTITIVRKGGSQDVLYFNKSVAIALKRYIKHERGKLLKKKEESALFISILGKRLGIDAIERMVKKYSLLAVPNKKITPHKLRSTFATALYRATGDIRLVADVLGHENVNTTISYYAAMEDEHRKRAATSIEFSV